MADKRYLVLQDNPSGTGIGPYKFGDVTGYGAYSSDDLEDAKAFCNDQAARLGRLRVVDRQTYNRKKKISVLYEVPGKT